MTISTLNSNNQDSEGTALREFFNDLFLERAGTNGASSDDDCDSSCVTSDSDSVSLSSEESTNENDNDDSKKINDLNGNTNHTRRRRFRHSRGLKPQRPKFAVAQDNARAVRVSSYHNNLSNSAHSLGSRTGISNHSVNNWRNSQHKRRSTAGRKTSRNNHRDSRWSTSGTEIPKNSNSNRVKTYDFGFVNDSLHNPTSLRSKKNRNIKKGSSISSGIRTKNSKTRLALSCSSTIDQAVRLVNDISSDSSDTDGEEFYDDEETSFSSFSMYSVAISKCSKTSNKAKALPSSRLPITRTKSSGDLPRIPRRTTDDYFKVSIREETFEPLKGESDGFQKSRLQRSMSDDICTTVSSMSNSQHFDRANHRSFDPVGRWAATITTKSHRSDRALLCPAPPRRKLSAHSRNMGRNSNHSNDSSEPSDSESESSFGFLNSYEDDSMTATVATTDSSAKASSESSASYEQDIKIFLPHRHSSGHSQWLSIPESLRKLPNHSFHGSSTISSKTTFPNKHPGKSLIRSSVRIR